MKIDFSRFVLFWFVYYFFLSFAFPHCNFEDSHNHIALFLLSFRLVFCSVSLCFAFVFKNLAEKRKTHKEERIKPAHLNSDTKINWKLRIEQSFIGRSCWVKFFYRVISKKKSNFVRAFVRRGEFYTYNLEIRCFFFFHMDIATKFCVFCGKKCR